MSANVSKSETEGQESDSYQYEQGEDCDVDELFAVEGKGKGGFEGTCFKCEDTRLTDAGRKEGLKEEKETGRNEKDDPKESEDQKENGQIQVTRGTILGIIPIGTARRMVLRLIRAVSLKSSCEEFSEPKHVRKGHCANTLQLENSGTFANENRFSILASNDDEKFWGGCEVAKQVTRIKSRIWKICGERDDEFSGRDERGNIGGERDDEFSCRDERVDECMGPEIKVTRHRTLNASKSNAHHVSYFAKSEVDCKGVHHVGDSGWRRVSAVMDSGSAE